MSFVNRILSFLKHDQNNIAESESVQKTLLLNFTIITLSIISLIFSIVHLFFFDKPTGYILISFSIIFSLVYIFFRRTKNYDVFSIITLLLVTGFLLFFTLTGIGEKTGLLWGLTYPIIVFFTFNIKKANYFSLIFLGIILFIFIVPSDIWVEYSTGLKVRFTGIYLGIFMFLQFYIRLKQQVNNIKEKQIIDFKQKIRNKDEFISNLSYQIRTPLNNIAGIFNLKRDALGKEIVEEVELSISNLITIVNSIPDLFDKKLLQIIGEKTLFNINSTIKKSVSLFQTDKYSNLKSSIHLSNKIPQQVYGDRVILIQIIISVIDFFYNNKNRDTLKIDIISTLKDNSDLVLLKIKSNSEYKIMEPFLNPTSTIDFDKINNKDLLIIKELTNLLSGQFEINYDESSTSFIFSLNFLEEKHEKQEITNNTKIHNDEDFFSSTVKKELKDATILLVEDDVMNSKVMTLNLQKHVKKIIIAENGKEALEKYASTRVDIILMDIRMPLMDGFKTTEKIREAEIGIGFKIPIIAVTANASEEIKKKCFDVGMNDYTTKPTNFELLLSKMKAQLS